MATVKEKPNGFAKTTELMPYESVYKCVANYEAAVKNIKAGYALIGEAQKLAGEFAKYWGGLYGRGSSYDIDEYAMKAVLADLKAKTWAGILEKTQAQKFMTTKRYNDFQKALEKPDELPEITFETVRDFVENLVESAPDMILEFIKETFDWLKPGTWMQEYKTNQKSEFEIGEKIIKSYVFDAWYSPPRLSYRAEQPMRAMDSAFHLMDGKGIPNGSSAVAAFEAARANGMSEAETEYFKFKWYKNGNCHIQFKRMDLVAKMNQIAGENMLKGKSRYN